LWIFNFLSISTQTEVAQALGRKDQQRAAEISSLALLLGVLFSVGVIVIMFPGAPLVSRLLGAEAAVEANAVLYLRVRLLGAPAVLVSLIGFGVLRGLQDMRTPLIIAAAVSLLNVGLDYPLIFGWGVIPAWGVAGAAAASVTAQYIGAVWTSVIIARRLGIVWHVSRADVGALLRVGGDLFVRTGLLTLFILITTRIANQIGPEAGAAHQGLRTIWFMLGYMMDGFAVTAQSLVGYFYGAKAIALARRAAGMNVLWGLILGGALTLAMLLLEPYLVALLIPADAVGVLGRAWVIAALIQPVAALAFVTDGIHWGTGDYTFLRNGMLLATGSAALMLAFVNPSSAAAFEWLWVITGVWVGLRMLLGMGRIWVSWGGSPLQAPHEQRV
jgi:MATE family multidrug resistance protein